MAKACAIPALLSFLLYITFVVAHSRLDTPEPRSDDDNLKVGPCGDLPYNPDESTTVEPGPFTFEWTETISHPGTGNLQLHRFNMAWKVGFDWPWALIRMMIMTLMFLLTVCLFTKGVESKATNTRLRYPTLTVSGAVFSWYRWGMLYDSFNTS